jgi:hypothetical protein
MQKKSTIASESSQIKNPEKLVDGNKMADALSVSPKTLQRLREERVISYYRVRGGIRYHLEEVMAAFTAYHVKSRMQLADELNEVTR